MSRIHRMLCLSIAPFLLAAASSAHAQVTPAQAKLTNVKIVYPAPSSTTWPLWIAQDAGLFEKYGLNATVEFALHPAGPAAVVSGEALTHNLGLDTALLAGMRGDQLVIIGSPLLVGQFALVGSKAIKDAKTLEKKRIAIGRVGDPPYFYALGVLEALKVDTKGLRGAPIEWTKTNHYRTRQTYRIYSWDTAKSQILRVKDWIPYDVK